MALYALIYASSATRSISEEDLSEILSMSRTNNMRDEITGMLLYRDGEFMQALEGSRESVLFAHQRIARDSRHHSLVTIMEGEIAERSFTDWSMGFRDLSGMIEPSMPGRAHFLDRSFTDAAFFREPSLAQRMLISFTEKGWLAEK